MIEEKEEGTMGLKACFIDQWDEMPRDSWTC